MPRAKQVTMGKLTPQESHEAALKKAIKTHEPYSVTESALVGIDDEDHPWAVVFTAPVGGERKVVATRANRSNAIMLRELLSEAWAEGYWAAGQKGKLV